MGTSDWVKNGDRWTVHHVHRDGSLAVQHNRNRRLVTLPAGYVHVSAELGYATTIHGAQGTTAATVHALATGEETRQQLYTMATRGADANHLYLQVVGDGDPHDLTRPENVRPPTATELLENILTRDDAPASATTTGRDHASPTTRLGHAAARYLDALHVAAEHHLGPHTLAALEIGAERTVPGIHDEPAWPTLRAHLILLTTTGTDPLTALHSAASNRELDTADDRAAVLHWRLPDPDIGQGPLPWLPGIPRTVSQDRHWGPYLTARADLVTTLDTEVRHQVSPTPAWWPTECPLPDRDLLGDLAVWRAANTIPDTDHRPTGPTQPSKALRRWQRELDARLGQNAPATFADWARLVTTLVPAARNDDYTPQLARHLAILHLGGTDAHALLHAATTAPLPDDHAASALWWRIQPHLPEPGNGNSQYPTMHRPRPPGGLLPEDMPTDIDQARSQRHCDDHQRRIPPARHDPPRSPGIPR
jgi:hypothetical protein